jgi:hypothetical protein
MKMCESNKTIFVSPNVLEYTSVYAYHINKNKLINGGAFTVTPNWDYFFGYMRNEYWRVLIGTESQTSLESMEQ